MISDDDADKLINWSELDGASAWNFIDKHAIGRNETRSLMAAWLRAKTKAAVLAEREECAKTCDAQIDPTAEWEEEIWNSAARACADAIRMRSNAEVTRPAASGRSGEPKASEG